jgi:hypothetical protein
VPLVGFLGTDFASKSKKKNYHWGRKRKLFFFIEITTVG